MRRPAENSNEETGGRSRDCACRMDAGRCSFRVLILRARTRAAGFPHVVRVRLWYLHPPHELKVRADSGGATLERCSNCKETTLSAISVSASGTSIQVEGDRSPTALLRFDGAYQLNAPGQAPVHADFPIELRADNGHLVVTAFMPMEEYIAGVLAGETGNFKSDEALKAMSVAARTYAEHFGSRHALERLRFL